MKIKNGFKYEINGWTYISIKGNPYERGYAHGVLLKSEIELCLKTNAWNLMDSYGFDIHFFRDFSNYVFKEPIQEKYPEFYEELKGIAEGAKVNIDDLIIWNNIESLGYTISKIPEYIKDISELEKKYGKIIEGSSGISAGEGGAADKCSAFMAIGDYTHDGKICCAHNTFDNFIGGQFCSIIIDLKPTKGHRMLYQGSPGFISSQTDFYVNSKGFIGTETTIGGFNKYRRNTPVGVRIRNCMQYANTLDDYVEMLKENNSGDYANSWLIADTTHNEIMRIELGLDFVNVERKKNGYFIGFNAPYDSRIRNIECVNTGFDDIRRHQGARKVRLEQLMEQHKGKINIDIAKEIIADHYDVYLNKINPSSRTCCSHYNLDDRAFMSQADRPLPYQPRGAVDGCVADSKCCKDMGFHGRWGSSCGMPFYKDEFVKRNIQWKRYGPWLLDRPSRPWTYFSSYHNKHNSTISKKKSKNKRSKKK